MIATWARMPVNWWGLLQRVLYKYDMLRTGESLGANRPFKEEMPGRNESNWHSRSWFIDYDGVTTFSVFRNRHFLRLFIQVYWLIIFDIWSFMWMTAANLGASRVKHSWQTVEQKKNRSRLGTRFNVYTYIFNWRREHPRLLAYDISLKERN